MQFKIIKSNKKIGCFGGTNLLYQLLKKYGIKEIIDKSLGRRDIRAKYTYGDIIVNEILSILSGSECLSDIEVFKKLFSTHPELKFSSADTVAYVCNQLKTITKIIKTKNNKTQKEITHEININTPLNNALLDIVIKLGILNNNQDNILDLDHVVLENLKHDSRYTYNSLRGYQPGCCFIGKLAIYIEGRNGNSPAKYLMAEILERCFVNFNSNGIIITDFRSDSAANQLDVINVVEKYTNCFYIRAINSQELKHQISLLDECEWKAVEINNKKYEVASVKYYPFGGSKAYRVIIQREKLVNYQLDLFNQIEYTHIGILTNNWIITEKDGIEFYNQRGTIEKNFDIFNNDFNWKKLPFSFLDANTVYMIITAIANNMFEFIKQEYSKVSNFVDVKHRLKKFIFNFILVPFEWIKRGRQWYLKLYTDKPYDLLL